MARAHSTGRNAGPQPPSGARKRRMVRLGRAANDNGPGHTLAVWSALLMALSVAAIVAVLLWGG